MVPAVHPKRRQVCSVDAVGPCLDLLWLAKCNSRPSACEQWQFAQGGPSLAYCERKSYQSLRKVPVKLKTMVDRNLPRQKTLASTPQQFGDYFPSVPKQLAPLNGSLAIILVATQIDRARTARCNDFHCATRICRKSTIQGSVKNLSR